MKKTIITIVVALIATVIKQKYSVINQLSPYAVKITYDDFVKIINDVCRNDWGILA